MLSPIKQLIFNFQTCRHPGGNFSRSHCHSIMSSPGCSILPPLFITHEFFDHFICCICSIVFRLRGDTLAYNLNRRWSQNSFLGFSTTTLTLPPQKLLSFSDRCCTLCLAQTLNKFPILPYFWGQTCVCSTYQAFYRDPLIMKAAPAFSTILRPSMCAFLPLFLFIHPFVAFLSSIQGQKGFPPPHCLIWAAASMSQACDMP